MLIREVFVKQAPHINVGDTVLHQRMVRDKKGKDIVKCLFIEVLRVYPPDETFDSYKILGVYEIDGKKDNIHLIVEDGSELYVAEKLSMEY